MPIQSSVGLAPNLKLVAPLIFASGFAALVFQVAWMRELRLIFGATTAATAAVLAIFMAGLGIGSAVLGKRVDRVANPLLFYGLLEVTIALCAAVSPWLVTLVSSIYFALGGQESLGLVGATLIRLALSTCVMAVPTFLMGGTLPAAVKAVTQNSDVHRRALGVLYGSNTLGAVFGAAVTTFVALENLGTRATLWAGCAIGLLAGVIAVDRARKTSLGMQDRQSVVDRVLDLTSDDDSSARPSLIYLAAATLGFTFFALELVWYRMLGPILGGTAFTFGLILCVALFGIGMGGIAYDVFYRRLKPTWSALAITCGCEAALIMVPYALGDHLALHAAGRKAAAGSFGQLVFGWGEISSIVILPVALVSGLQFPLLIALLGHGRQTISKHLGMTYAWNTLGAIAGSLIAGFGGMPLLSAPGLWKAIAALIAILSLAIAFGAPVINRRAFAVVVGLVLLTVGLMFTQGPTAVWRHSGVGAGRGINLGASTPNKTQGWIHIVRGAPIWEADGIESSVAILGQAGLSFIVNGKSDGNALADAATQIGVSLLAAVLHEDPKTALVIGLGTGESAGWLAEMRNIEQVDVVELEPAIDEMAHRCRELNHDVLNHPRVRRIYDDGREFVFSTRYTYDLVVSEPSNPYRAGVAALYTTEFYRAVRQRLKPGGLFVQWLQAYEIDAEAMNLVLATAGSEFRHVEVWQTLPTDLQLICSDSPIEFSAEELRRRIGTGTVRDAMSKAWHVEGAEGFLSHFVATSGWANELATTPGQLLNTDDRTLLEYGFAKTVGLQTSISVEPLRDRLRSLGLTQKRLRGDPVDWTLVERWRQQSNLIFDGQLSDAFLPSLTDRALVEAFGKFRERDFTSAIGLWPVEYRHLTNDIQRLVLATCFAELAQPECLELLSAAETGYPIEAAAIRGIYYFRAEALVEAEQSIATFYSLLQSDPWAVPQLVESVFTRTTELVRAEPKIAARLYPLFAQPFASRCFDSERISTRIALAEHLGPEYVVESLAESEPNVPWTDSVLKARAEAYTAMNHPLARRAEQDWQWFQRPTSQELNSSREDVQAAQK